MNARISPRLKLFICFALCGALLLALTHPVLASPASWWNGWGHKWHHVGTDGPFDAPELDVAALSSGVVLCIGAVLLLVERIRRRP